MTIALTFKVPGVPTSVVVPVTAKSQAQAMINVLDMARVYDVRVVSMREGAAITLYVPHMTTHQLVKPQE